MTSGPADLFCISSRTSKCNFHQHYWEGLKFCLSSTLIQVFSTQRAVAPEKFLRKYLLSLLLIFAQNTLIIISEFHRTLKGKGVPKIQRGSAHGQQPILASGPHSCFCPGSRTTILVPEKYGCTSIQPLLQPHPSLSHKILLPTILVWLHSCIAIGIWTDTLPPLNF